MQTKIKRRPLGNTGVSVSEVSLGAMNIRQLPDHETVQSFLNAVLDAGVNLIDTARAYTTKTDRSSKNESGVFISSEDMVGKAIAARDDIDEPIVIITKGHGYDIEAFDEQLAESCANLQIRKEADGLYIGKTKVYLVYFLHGIKEDRWGPILESGVIEYAKKRQAAGDFTWFGFSSHYGDGDVIKAAIDTGAFQVCELPYNVYNLSLAEESPTIDYIKYAHDNGLGVINMKAFNGNGTTAIFPQIADYAGFGYDEMLKFCLANPYITSVDVGAVNMAQFNADIEASLSPVLTGGERTTLVQQAKRVAPYLKSICRECMHCVEAFSCPMNIDFPHILGLHGRFVVSSGLGFDTSDFRRQYAEFSPSADECIACGGCTPWCEYHLDVPEMMKKAAADLG